MQATLIKPLDIPRSRACVHRRLLGWRGQETRLPDLLYRLPRREHRASSAEPLRRTARLALRAEFR